MALDFKVVTFAKPTSAQTITVTPGFQIKALRIYGVYSVTAGTFVDNFICSMGLASYDGSTIVQKSVSGRSVDNQGTSDSGRVYDANSIIQIRNQSSATILAEGNLQNITSTSFDINFTTADATAATFICECYGGSDITDAKVIAFNTGTGTGNVDITSVGFQGDFVFFALSNATSDTQTTGTHTVWSIGHAKSSTKRGAISLVAEHGRTVADTWRYQRTDKCLVHLVNTTGALDGEADFVSFLSNGFRFNVSDAFGSSWSVIALVIKGGLWDCGSLTVPSGSPPVSQDTTTTGITPKGVILESVGNTASSSIVSTARISIGAADSASSRASCWSGDEDAADPTISAAVHKTDKIISMINETATASSSSLEAEADITELTSEKFTLSWTNNTVTALQALWIVVGIVGLERISKQLTLKWNTTGRISKQLSLKWNNIARLSKQLTLKWNNHQRISKQLTLKWNNLQRISKQLTVKWNNVARISKQLILKWNNHARISKQLTLKWNNLLRVSKQLSLKWNVQQRISKQLTLKWNTIQRISKQLTLKWNVEAALERISKSLTLKWNTLQRVRHAVSIILDGDADHIDAGIQTGLWSKTLNKFSFSIWVRPTNVDGLEERTVIALGGDSEQGHFHMRWGATDFVALLWDIAENVVSVSTSDLPDINNTWWHFLVTFDKDLGSDNLKLYMNGSFVSATDFTSPIPFPTNESLYLGVINGAFSVLAGNLKDFRFWEDEAITAEQAEDVFNNDPSAPTPSYWLKMEEGTGNPVDTISGTLEGSLEDDATWNNNAPTVWVIIGKSLTLKWNNMQRISKQLTLKWHNLQRISKQLTIKWNNIQRISKSLTLKWNNLQRIAKSLILKWDVHQRISKSLTLKWHNLQRVSKQLTVKWNNFILVSKQLTLKWHVHQRISKQLTLKWDNMQRISKQLTLIWNTIERVSKPLTLKWDNLQRIEKQLTLKWNNLERIAKSLTLKWDIQAALERISKSLTLKWNTHARVSKQLTLKWDNLLRVAKQLSLKWNTNERISKQLTLLWNTHERISKSLTLKWQSLLRVSKQLVLKWNSLSRIEKQLTLKWDNLARVSKSLTLKWDNLQRISKSLTVKWNNVARVSKELILKWNVEAALERISKSLTLKWNTDARVSKSLTLKWNNLLRVSKQLTLKWHNLQRISKQLTLKWNNFARISKSLTLKWDNIQRISKQLRLKWNTHVRVSKQLTLRWNNLILVSKTLTLKWNTNARVSVSLILRWIVESTILPPKIFKVPKQHFNVKEKIPRFTSHLRGLYNRNWGDQLE